MGDTAANAVAKQSKRSASENGGATKKSSSHSGVISDNIYCVLQDNDVGNPLTKKRKRKPIDSSPVPVLKEKCPPIFILGDPPLLRPTLRDCFSNGYFKGSFRLCADGVKLMLDSKQCFNAAVDFLKRKNWEFYTHDLPGSKPVKVLLRGLDDMDVDELCNILRENGQKPLNAFKIARRDATRKHRDQLYLVHFEHGSTNIQELRKIRIVNSTNVDWQKYKPVHRDVTQCQNCYRFGHGTRNCAMVARCGKCGENHRTDSCDKMEETDPKCVNCGDKHRATVKACPKRAEFLEIRQRAASRNKPKPKTVPVPALNDQNFPPIAPRHTVPILPPLQPQRRLAAAAASVPPQAPSAPTPNQWQLPPPGFRQQQDHVPLPPEDAAPLHSKEQLVLLFNQLVAKLRGCKTRLDQIHALGLFVIENGY